MSVVKDDTERFALTKDSVQDGDVVKVQSTNLMYYVVDDSKLSTEAGYEVFKAGSAASVPWGGVTGKPSTFPPSSHTHTKSQITDFPSSMPNPNNLTMQIEGNVAAVYNGGTAQAFNVTKSALGLDKVNNTADADKSVKYASSAPWGGVTGKPSTFTPSSHTHTKDQVGLGNVANLDQSKAIKSITRSGMTFTATALDGTTSTFTQQDINTTYGLASQSSNGLMSAADKKAIDREFFRLLPKGGTYIPANADLNTIEYIKVGTYYNSLSRESMTMKNIPIGAAFIMCVLSPLSEDYDNEETSAWVYRLRIFIDYSGQYIFTQFVRSDTTPGKFTYGPWNSVAYKSDIPTSLPASDVYSWAKASSKPSYSWSEITGKPSTFPPSSHTHTKSQITDFPSSIKNPNALSITANGTTVTYDGSSAQSISIASGGSKSVSSTLLASGWSGSAAPYTYDLGSTYADKSVMIGYDGTKYSEDSMTAASDAGIVGGEGTVIYAYGEKPTVDIPIIIQYS